MGQQTERRAPPEYNSVVCSGCGRPKDVVNGEWLRYLRECTGRSLRDVAAQMKCSPAFVSDVERNNRRAPDWLVATYVRLR